MTTHVSGTRNMLLEIKRSGSADKDLSIAHRKGGHELTGWKCPCSQHAQHHILGEWSVMECDPQKCSKQQNFPTRDQQVVPLQRLVFS